jgi:hypothetical protein
VQEVLAAAGRVYARRDLEAALSSLLMDKRVRSSAHACTHACIYLQSCACVVDAYTVITYCVVLMFFQVIIPRDLIALLERNRARAEKPLPPPANG